MKKRPEVNSNRKIDIISLFDEIKTVIGYTADL